MSWRKIAIMYAVSAVLALYVYGQLRGAEEPVEVRTEALAPIVPMLSTRVTHVGLRWTGQALTLRRDGSRWAVEHPKGIEVTTDLVEAVLDTLTTIVPIDVISEGGIDSDEFGLADPAARLRITGDLPEPIELTIGGHNPTRTAVYAARVDENRVYLLGLAARYYVQLLFEEVSAQTAPAPPASEPAATL